MGTLMVRHGGVICDKDSPRFNAGVIH